MRVLALSVAYLPHMGGIEVLLHDMAAELVRRGHQIEIVSADRVGPGEVDGVVVHRIDVDGPVASKDVRAIRDVQRRLGAIVDRFDPDVVHAHEIGPLLWTYQRATRARRRPLVATVHNTMTEMVGLPASTYSLMAGLLGEADVVTAVSELAVTDTLSFAPLIRDSIRYVPNGVSAPCSSGQPVDRDLVVGVGRLAHQKGWDVAIDAMRLVRERRPQTRMMIAGVGDDEEDLRRRIEAAGLVGVVVLAGRLEQAEARRLMERAALVVMPSRFEGLPLVALEAAWAGRPVVGARVSGLTEAVVDGVTGVLVDGEQPALLADAMLGVLDDPSRSDALGGAAVERARALYGLGSCVDRYEAIYRELTTAR
ncbi:MAG: hypothetical protein RI958_2877 [Actinomycetota bacterium]